MQRGRIKSLLLIAFNATKVRATASCTFCGAVRCIYSNNMVGLPGGPSETQFEDLQRMLENEGYRAIVSRVVARSSARGVLFNAEIPLNHITTIQTLEPRAEEL